MSTVLSKRMESSKKLFCQLKYLILYCKKSFCERILEIVLNSWTHLEKALRALFNQTYSRKLGRSSLLKEVPLRLQIKGKHEWNEFFAELHDDFVWKPIKKSRQGKAVVEVN